SGNYCIMPYRRTNFSAQIPVGNALHRTARSIMNLWKRTAQIAAILLMTGWLAVHSVSVPAFSSATTSSPDSSAQDEQLSASNSQNTEGLTSGDTEAGTETDASQTSQAEPSGQTISETDSQSNDETSSEDISQPSGGLFSEDSTHPGSERSSE